jgi:hypothetical protein
MPELDFMVVADYVRAEGGVLHMIAAGFDTIWTPTVPVMRPVGVGMRLTMTLAELKYEHDVELIFQDTDGRHIAQVNAKISAQPMPLNLPAGRPLAVAMALNLMLPIPNYGNYSLELLVDRGHKKSIDILVSPPVAGMPGMLPGLPGPAGHA